VSRVLFSRAMQSMGLYERMPHAWKIWSAAIALAPKVPRGLLENQGVMLRRLRGNLTRAQAGKIVGVNDTRWSHWEAERMAPTKKQLHGFASKAGRMFDHYQLGGEPPRGRPRQAPGDLPIPRTPRLPKRPGGAARRAPKQKPAPGQGDAIRALRGTLSPDQAALVANVSRATWREWEAEQVPADWSMLEGFAARAAKRYLNYMSATKTRGEP